MKYYDKKNNRIIFVDKKADEYFWDKQWLDKNIKSVIESGRNDKFVSSITKKYITPDKDKVILEGGCGCGNMVRSLKCRGYSSIGIDYAEETIRKIRSVAPDLDVRIGDVRKLDFEDNYFDGYWSLGVIEHFYSGYDEIAREMQRVIKKQGYLFLTFPSISIVRKIKARLGFYELYNESNEKIKDFYQFALDPKSVKDDFENLGFVLAERRYFDGFKGLKDEILVGSVFLKKINQSDNFSSKAFKYIISKSLSFFCGHCTLLVFKKL